MSSLLESVNALINSINQEELEQASILKSRKFIETELDGYTKKLTDVLEELSVLKNAVDLLQTTTNKSLSDSYKFIEYNLNQALERVFPDDRNRVELYESTKDVYPQLEFIMHTPDGDIRSVDDDSGHGMAQVISVLSNLCLIVIRNARRFVELDEVTSGLDENTRKLFEYILWEFTTIGFQIVLIEHRAKPPKFAKVIALEGTNDGTVISNTYIEGVTGNTDLSRHNSYEYLAKRQQEADAMSAGAVTQIQQAQQGYASGVAQPGVDY